MGGQRTGKLIDGSKGKWKPDIGAIRPVIHFVKATQRYQAQTIQRVEEE
jgi:hypothetical protein